MLGLNLNQVNEKGHMCYLLYSYIVGLLQDQ